MIDRAHLSRWLPASVKTRIRPFVVGPLYRREQRRLRLLYGAFVSRGGIVFDVGAAEGYHTEVFVELGATVICLEPQPALAEALHRRFEDRSDVTVLASGAGARADTLPLAMSTGDPEISTLDVEKWSRGRFRGRTWDRTVQVPIVTLDQVAATHGQPGFIKIDVEGFETDVLEGLRVAPAALSFEFSREFLDDVGTCIEALERLGSPSFNYSLYRRHRLESSAWLTGDELLTTLRTSPGRRLAGDVFTRFD